MREQIAANWWVLAVRGAFAMILGIIAFTAPGAALAVLVLFFSAYALIDGVFALLAAARWHHVDERWWLLILEGVVGIGVGIFVFVHPAASALGLVTVIAIWAIMTGIAEIVAAIRLHRIITGEWLLGISGALSLLLGVALLAAPGAGLLFGIYLMGAYALLFGISLLVLAFRLRGHAQGRTVFTR
jgi:uncharacterized membrane protein HdeD (DUF308 family)